MNAVIILRKSDAALYDFAGDSYEEIKHDEMLYSLNTGSYIIPIIKKIIF